VPVTTDGLLEFAKTLASSIDEVQLRASVSRAYYSAYHYAKNYADEYAIDILKAPPEYNGGMHADLIYSFMTHSAKNVRAAGHALNEAKSLRTKADYYLDQKIIVANALATIAHAETVRRKL
jgi:uncharacterized protein (UPF0332 family)